MTVPTDPVAVTAEPVAATAGVGLLAMAADLLPTVVGDGPMLSSDVHATLLSAASALPGGDDRAHAQLAADHAEELFAAYLVAAGEVGPARSAGRTVRGWATGSPMWAVTRGLRAAAAHFCRSEARPSL
jgi:hypothetical protein